MVLQSEFVDEDLEHFEDIVEETDNESNTAPMNRENARLVNISDGLESNSDSSKDLADSPDVSFSSDDDISDEADDLVMGDDLNNLQETRAMPNYGRHQSMESVMRSLLPGGYNPRLREPSYWYLYLWASFLS